MYPTHKRSSKSECDELRSANSQLRDELEQLKEKYHSQLGDGVRIKHEVRGLIKRSTGEVKFWFPY